MSGHSKWSTIKHKKAATDAKRGQVFSKLSKLITIAAKKGRDPSMNFELKYAIDQAKSANMPADKIDRAVKKGIGELKGENLEEILFEAFGPGGSAIIITGITDNTNRTSNELKHLLKENDAKLGGPGSAIWAFNKKESGEYEPQTPLEISEEDSEKLRDLVEKINEHEDVQKTFINVV